MQQHSLYLLPVMIFIKSKNSDKRQISARLLDVFAEGGTPEATRRRTLLPSGEADSCWCKSPRNETCS
jgi:hypothetical protein